MNSLKRSLIEGNIVSEVKALEKIEALLLSALNLSTKL